MDSRENALLIDALNRMLAKEHACAIRYATHAALVTGPHVDPVSKRLQEIAADETAHAARLRKRIRALGVGIVMDDFGTGYSCLSYFRQFPFDKIKIDRSFVHDMLDDYHARSIVEAVISLGRGLGLKVVAEGVETDAQLAMLQAQGCSQVQGFLLSRPGPIERFVGPVLAPEAERDEQALRMG